MTSVADTDRTAGPQSEGLTAKDIAEIWQLPIGTVYWLANKHKWLRFKRSGRVRYSAHDVLAALG